MSFLLVSILLFNGCFPTLASDKTVAPFFVPQCVTYVHVGGLAAAADDDVLCVESVQLANRKVFFSSFRLCFSCYISGWPLAFFYFPTFFFFFDIESFDQLIIDRLGCTCPSTVTNKKGKQEAMKYTFPFVAYSIPYGKRLEIRQRIRKRRRE